PVEQAALGELALADLDARADDGVGAGVGLGVQVAEAAGHRVAEHEGARQEGHAQQDGRAGGQEAPLVGAERLEGGAPHGRQLPSSFIFSSTRSAVGAGIWSTIRPSARNTTASAWAAATGSWVTMTTVCAISSTAARRNASTSAPLRESRLPVGSSAKTTSGRLASARAT